MKRCSVQNGGTAARRIQLQGALGRVVACGLDRYTARVFCVEADIGASEVVGVGRDEGLKVDSDIIHVCWHLRRECRP